MNWSLLFLATLFAGPESLGELRSEVEDLYSFLLVSCIKKFVGFFVILAAWQSNLSLGSVTELEGGVILFSPSVVKIGTGLVG